MTTESMGSILQQRLLREERGKSERLFALLVELKTGIDNLEGLGSPCEGEPAATSERRQHLRDKLSEICWRVNLEKERKGDATAFACEAWLGGGE